MSKSNPFRNEPSVNIKQNVEDWGKSKFVPKVFKSGNRKHLDSSSKPFSKRFDNRKSNFNKNKETLRFNEVAKDAKPENSTPWSKYKDEVVFKQRDEEQARRQANMESEEAKTALKQREINYRKSLVQQKKNETTTWEDFGEESIQVQQDSKSHKAGHTKQRGDKSKFQSNAKNNLNAGLKTKFKKNNPKSDVKGALISKDLLRNFDSRKLSYEQNDKLRKIITKTTCLMSQRSLQNVVSEMKKKKEEKEKSLAAIS